jgi:hypothetical protein
MLTPESVVQSSMLKLSIGQLVLDDVDQFNFGITIADIDA